MDLRWPWLALALAALLVAALVAMSWWRGRRRTPAGALLVANSARVRELPRFRSLARREAWLAEWQTLGVVVAAVGALLLAARPQATDVTTESHNSRDIVLCMDASASMFDEDVAVIDAYREIVDGLHGERISLVLWSDAAVTVFPLTDDYDFVQDQLKQAAHAFAVEDPDYVAGTYLGHRASIFTDGLVSCTQRFDHAGEDRGRAIVIASDNDPQGGPPYFTMQEAAQAAVQRHIRVYGIGSLDLASEPDKRVPFEDAMKQTGGGFWLLGQDRSVESITEGIEQLEADRVQEPPKILRVERPGPAIALTGAGVLMLVLGWGVALVRRRRGGAP
jgi:hypothetical protein